MQTTDVSKLIINKLTEAQYQSAKVAGELNPYEIYMTESEEETIPASEKGAANGVATLGNDGKVPSTQLPQTSSAELRTATLTIAGWTLGSDGRYAQSVAAQGVTASTKIVFVDANLMNKDEDGRAEILTAWALVSVNECVQGTNTLTFYAAEVPEAAVPINIGVIN